MARGQCRAGWTRHIVQGLDALPWKTRLSVRARIDPSTLDEIESSLALGWLPLALHIEVMEKTRDVLGDEAYRDFWRARTAASLDMPLLFGKVARVMLRKVGGDPLSFVRTIPMSFRYVVRNAGTMSAEITPEWATLTLDRFPTEHPHEAWTQAWVGALSALSESFIKSDCAVTLAESAPERGRFVWRLELGSP